MDKSGRNLPGSILYRNEATFSTKILSYVGLETKDTFTFCYLTSTAEMILEQQVFDEVCLSEEKQKKSVKSWGEGKHGYLLMVNHVASCYNEK